MIRASHLRDAAEGHSVVGAVRSGFALFAVVPVFLSLALLPVTLGRAGGPGVALVTRIGLKRLLADLIPANWTA